jgi:hypothetical protein
VRVNSTLLMPRLKPQRARAGGGGAVPHHTPASATKARVARVRDGPAADSPKLCPLRSSSRNPFHTIGLYKIRTHYEIGKRAEIIALRT